ncbi:MAG: SPASM domain-containing protein [Bryobacteraceae bacterium]|nr:SPASM domain-containing protein [Bryobacteraceae bacterium]
MESLYWVMSWLCHRTCVHCYEDRFRPYHGADLERVLAEARNSFPRIIANLPARLTYRDRSGEERHGRIILAGGELLLEPVRETVLYPALRLLRDKYGSAVTLIVQTTGDLVSTRIAAELAANRIDVLSVSGIDAHHAGLETEEARAALMAKVRGILNQAGWAEDRMTPGVASPARAGQIRYHFFGAQPGSWIGKLWPRGRAHQNELSTADIADNFCNQWSGGLNFLRRQEAGSEVSIEPGGKVYPCCMKTAMEIGDVSREPLEQILDRLAGDPVYQAINAGEPQRMGLNHGWTEERFLKKSETVLPSGRAYRNLCIGCDAFHREVLMPGQALVQIG